MRMTGRVLFEVLSDQAVPPSLQRHREILSLPAQAYEAINAPRGTLGAATLTGISTAALSGDDATYAVLEAKIRTIAKRRDEIAGKIIELLEKAAYAGPSINEAEAAPLITQANALLASVR